MRECEELLKCVQRNRDSQLDFAASHQIEAHVPSMPEDEASRQLFTTGQKFQTGQAVCSRLELATQPNCKARTPCLAKYDFSHSFSPYYIYTLIPTIQRGLPERILREQP